MSNLVQVKSETFGNVQCDFFQGQNVIWMTRRQIGEALEYEDPNQAVKNIHLRHKSRLDKFSRVVRIETPSGKQETTIYSAKGVYEICRWSHQLKADEFYDWVYEMLEALRKGEAILIDPAKEPDIHDAQRLRAEAMYMNAKTRQAKMIKDVALKFQDRLSSESIQGLVAGLTEFLMGKPILPLPKIEKTYTATEIGKEVGVTANQIGRISNANGLKTDEYGIMVLDKCLHSVKQIPSFRYNEKGKARLLELVGHLQ